MDIDKSMYFILLYRKPSNRHVITQYEYDTLKPDHYDCLQVISFTNIYSVTFYLICKSWNLSRNCILDITQALTFTNGVHQVGTKT